MYNKCSLGAKYQAIRGERSSQSLPIGHGVALTSLLLLPEREGGRGIPQCSATQIAHNLRLTKLFERIFSLKNMYIKNCERKKLTNTTFLFAPLTNIRKQAKLTINNIFLYFTHI